MLVTAEIPDSLVPWIAEAFGATFPTLTQGRSPSEAVRAVVLSWVQTTVISYATEKARAVADVQVQAAVAARDAATVAAAEDARQAAAAIAVGTITDLQPGEPEPDPADPA